MNSAVEIGKRIEQQIKYTGKTAAEIAREMGVNKSVLYNYIRGNSVPGGEMLVKLCKALDCSYEDILGEIK